MRLSNKELDKIKQQFGVSELYSYSRLDLYRTSPFLFFLKYIKKEKPKGEIESAYAQLGGIAHELLEQFYNGEKEYKQLLPEYESQFALNIDMLGLRFDKSDDDKNQSIRDKYYEDMRLFFENFIPVPVEQPIMMEQFIPIKIDDNIVLQGYLDQIIKRKDGTYEIIDFKSSSKYSGQAMIDHSHQLVLYCEGLRQKGVPKEKIRCGFNFLKYATFHYVQANGTVKEQHIERYCLAEQVSKKCYAYMKRNKWEDMDSLFEQISLNPYIINNIEHFKEAGFYITDCYIYIDQPFEIFEQLKKDIIQIVKEIEVLTKEYEETGNEKLWWDTEENCQKNSYFFTQLSEYSIDQIKPFAAWIEKQEKEKEYANDLLGVMSKNDDEEDWMKELFG